MLDAFYRYEYSAIFAKNPKFKRPAIEILLRKRIPQLPTLIDKSTQSKVVIVFPNNKVIMFLLLT